MRHRLFAVLVLLAVLVGLSGATFTWTNPTTRTDGSPLTNLAETRLWCGDQPGGSKTVWTTIPAPGESYSELFGLDQYCAATARDTAGLESPYSNEVFVLAQGSAPATPESPTIQFQPFTEPPVAITENPLTSSSSATNGTVFTSASITPGANRLVLLSVEGDTVSGGGFTLTVMGNGLTWVLVAKSAVHNTFNETHVYRAMGASPSAGAITMTSDVTLDTLAWSVAEFDGVDTSGTNGSGAVVQSNTNASDSASSLTVTLGAFGSADNATYGAFGAGTTPATWTAGTGFTEIHDVGQEFASISSEWRVDNDTSVDATASGTTGLGGVAIEIKAAAAGAAAAEDFTTSRAFGGGLSRGFFRMGGR